jgi:hypothetical protein
LENLYGEIKKLLDQCNDGELDEERLSKEALPLLVNLVKKQGELIHQQSDFIDMQNSEIDVLQLNSSICCKFIEKHGLLDEYQDYFNVECSLLEIELKKTIN